MADTKPAVVCPDHPTARTKRMILPINGSDGSRSFKVQRVCLACGKVLGIDEKK
jgi:hypothetical protein